MMHLYGGDEFASILENVDAKMTDDYKKTLQDRRAAKATAVTVDVPKDLNEAQKALHGAVTCIFKGHDAGPMVIAGVYEAVAMAFMKLREEEKKKALPPPKSPEDQKIAELRKLIEEQ